MNKIKRKKFDTAGSYLHPFFIVVLVCLNLYSVNRYFAYDRILNNDNSIRYIYLGKSIHSGGKGEHYDMRIQYRKNVYRVAITRKVYHDLDRGMRPELFITGENEVITGWNRVIAQRGIISTLLGIAVCCWLAVKGKGRIPENLRS